MVRSLILPVVCLKTNRPLITYWYLLITCLLYTSAKRFEDFGVESIIYTDIGRDGMLSGVNIEATVRLANATRIPVIASGGVTYLRDIEALCQVADEGVEGVILGRSIYEGTLDFEEALDFVDDYFEEIEE